jgi:hypothetical protein
MNDSRTANHCSSDYPQLKFLTRLSQALWAVARFPALAFLVVLAPIARLAFAGSALLCFLMAFFFRWASADPRFPFWGMLFVSITLAVALFLYEGLIVLLSRR